MPATTCCICNLFNSGSNQQQACIAAGQTHFKHAAGTDASTPQHVTVARVHQVFNNPWYNITHKLHDCSSKRRWQPLLQDMVGKKPVFVNYANNLCLTL
jgi:hypothetical protein